MRDASPAFQPERPGAPGFQLGEFGGFDTTTPAVVGALGARVRLASPSAFASGIATLTYIGELRAVVGLASRTSGPRLPGGRGRRWAVRPQPLLYRYVGELRVAVRLESRTWNVDIERLRHEDDELRAAFLGRMGQGRLLGGLSGADALVLLALLEDDDALVQQQREEEASALP
jgi:hypothetical protein